MHTNDTFLKSKFQGLIEGGIIGDSLGAAFDGQVEVEWVMLQEFIRKLNILNDHLSKTSSSSYQLKSTINTSLMLNVAISVISENKVNLVSIAKNLKGCLESDGTQESNAVMLEILSQISQIPSQYIFYPAGYYQGGLGLQTCEPAIMAASIVLYCHGNENDQILIDAVDKVTRLTHSHRNAVIGAVLFALALDSVLAFTEKNPPNPDEFINKLINAIGHLECDSETSVAKGLYLTPKRRCPQSCRELKWFIEYGHKSFCDKLRIMKSMLRMEISTSDVIYLLGNDRKAVSAVPLAIYAFLRGMRPIQYFPLDSAYHRTILYSVTMAGQTSCVTCMAGMLAGALSGVNSIPPFWQSLCSDVRKVTAIANGLFKLRSNAPNGIIESPEIQQVVLNKDVLNQRELNNITRYRELQTSDTSENTASNTPLMNKAHTLLGRNFSIFNIEESPNPAVSSGQQWWQNLLRVLSTNLETQFDLSQRFANIDDELYEPISYYQLPVIHDDPSDNVTTNKSQNNKTTNERGLMQRFAKISDRYYEPISYYKTPIIYEDAIYNFIAGKSHGDNPVPILCKSRGDNFPDYNQIAPSELAQFSCEENNKSMSEDMKCENALVSSTGQSIASDESRLSSVAVSCLTFNCTS